LVTGATLVDQQINVGFEDRGRSRKKGSIERVAGTKTSNMIGASLRKFAFGIVAGVFLFLGVTPARAETALRVVVTVDVDGAGCRSQRAAFEREVFLACEAMGTCKVSPSGLHAVVKATLVCLTNNESWWLRTETIEGGPITSVELRKAPDVDRLREAAVEVARAAPPAPTLTPPATRDEAAPVDADRTPPPPSKLPRFIGSISAGGNISAERQAGVGARLLGAIPIPGPGFTTVGGAVVAGGQGAGEMRHVRGGVGFALGAPFDSTSVFGVAAELGLDGMQAFGPPRTMSGIRFAETRFAPYAQASLFARYPKWNAVRPFAAASVIAFSDLPWVSGSLDLGAAFPIF
jgi:hypothetical protein